MKLEPNDHNLFEQPDNETLSSIQADQFQSILKNLPQREKRPRRSDQNETLEFLVAQFYPLLEQAHREKNYSYEELANLFQQHLHRPISKDTLRKYMGKFRRQGGTSNPHSALQLVVLYPTLKRRPLTTP